MLKPIAACLLPVIVAVAACTARAQGDPPPASSSADLQKFDAALAFLRARNARDYAPASPNSIDEARFVEIGGIQQWITIRGDDRNNPVLLFLHGGPGDAINPWAYAGFGGWSKHFTVVQWDQRGAGRTFGKNSGAPSGSITVARMTQDGIELAELLRRELRTDKLVLVGHSFGSILGVFMVKARPELFHAFVGTGQVADPRRNYAVAYSALLQKAQTLGDQPAIRNCARSVPRRTRTAAATVSSASGRTGSRGQTCFCRPRSGSHSPHRAPPCATCWTGSTDRVSAPSLSFPKPARSRHRRSAERSRCRCSSFRAPRTSPRRRAWRGRS